MEGKHSLSFIRSSCFCTPITTCSVPSHHLLGSITDHIRDGSQGLTSQCRNLCSQRFCDARNILCEPQKKRRLRCSIPTKTPQASEYVRNIAVCMTQNRSTRVWPARSKNVVSLPRVCSLKCPNSFAEAPGSRTKHNCLMWLPCVHTSSVNLTTIVA